MYIFLVVLAFGKKVRLEPKLNWNNWEPEYSVLEFFLKPIGSYFLETEFFWKTKLPPLIATKCYDILRNNKDETLYYGQVFHQLLEIYS